MDSYALLLAATLNAGTVLNMAQAVVPGMLAAGGGIPGAPWPDLKRRNDHRQPARETKRHGQASSPTAFRIVP